MINPCLANGFYIGLLIGFVLVSVLMYLKVKIRVLSAFTVLNDFADEEDEKLRIMKENSEYTWNYLK